MLIGVDLDNTIVCYDGLFHATAVRGGLIAADCPTDKLAIRERLHAAGRHQDWTELQGRIYGSEMHEARPFSGCADFFRAAIGQRHRLAIVSHRTRVPVLGAAVDLHRAAATWLRAQGFTDPRGIGLKSADVFLEETLAGKLARIAGLGCDVFVDDLPELLTHPDFPARVRRICFDPARRCQQAGLEVAVSWLELQRRLLSQEAPP